MPDTPIDQSNSIQSIRLKVPTGTVPVPPVGFGQLHSPSPGVLALRLPDGSVVEVGPAASGGGSGLQVTDPPITITSAELLDLHNTPKVLLAAQGAGKVVVPLAVTVRYHAGSTPYTLAGSSALLSVFALAAGYGQAWLSTARADLDGVSDGDFQVMSAPYQWLSAASIDNQPLVIGLDEAVLGGNGFLTVTAACLVV